MGDGGEGGKNEKEKIRSCNASSGPLAKDLRDHTGRGFEPIAKQTSL